MTKIVKNQNGTLELALFDLKHSNVMFRCQNLIGSWASTHSTFDLIDPCNRIQTHKARDTYAQTTDTWAILNKGIWHTDTKEVAWHFWLLQHGRTKFLPTLQSCMWPHTLYSSVLLQPTTSLARQYPYSQFNTSYGFSQTMHHALQFLNYILIKKFLWFWYWWLFGWVNMIITDDRLWNLSKFPALVFSNCLVAGQAKSLFIGHRSCSICISATSYNNLNIESLVYTVHVTYKIIMLT